jgi:molecular chaperone DnaK (HSP70)
MTGRCNEVVASEGIQRLGGDDFDEAILKLVRKTAKLRRLDAASREALLEECATRKEAVGPNTRRFLVDLSAVDRPPFCCGIDEVYAVCAPLVDKTARVLWRVLREPGRNDGDRDGEVAGDVDWSEVAGIYVVGGAGSFPLVARGSSGRRTRSPPPPSALLVSSIKRPASRCRTGSRGISACSARQMPVRTSPSIRYCPRASRCRPTAKRRWS